MPDSLGFSVYLSTFEDQWPVLENWAGTGAPVFLSLNMGEESGLRHRAEGICRTLAENGFRIIADVSTETVNCFQEPDLLKLAKRLGLYALRIDYGFTPEQIEAMARKMPIVLNASTTREEDACRIRQAGREVFGLHNFYPRPETGLDRQQLKSCTDSLHRAGLKVQAFIPGDGPFRGPIFAGLPTLEDHRGILPSAAFADLALNFGIDDIYVGDPAISQTEQDRIARFCREGILSVPARLQKPYEYLYDVVFTCRVDSPDRMVRFEESRTTMKGESPAAPQNCGERTRGSITMDNAYYGRYAGEIQMLRRDLKADPRVNVIGSVPENARLLMDCIRGNGRFTLVRP